MAKPKGFDLTLVPRSHLESPLESKLFFDGGGPGGKGEIAAHIDHINKRGIPSRHPATTRKLYQTGRPFVEPETDPRIKKHAHVAKMNRQVSLVLNHWPFHCRIPVKIAPQKHKIC
jgi:hypothetical protein